MGDLHRTDPFCSALDVPRHRTLGRATPRPSPVGTVMLSRLAVGALIVSLVAGSLAALSASPVGPNFKRPTPPAATGYGTAPAQGQTTMAEAASGNAQQFVE